MAGHTPDIDAVHQLCDELVEVANDYLLVFMFNGISSPDDVDRMLFLLFSTIVSGEDLSAEPTFLARQREQATKHTRRLVQVLYQSI